MDPNANITEQVQLARAIAAHPRTIETHSDDKRDRYSVVNSAERLAELVLALDEWRCKGGFAPAAAPASVDVDSLNEDEYLRHLEQSAVAGRAASAALLDLHQMMYPERYPRAVQPDHVFWSDHEESDCISTPEMGAAVFEWSAETIEWVSSALERALADHPDAVLKPR